MKKQEYFDKSNEEKLPKRCPILGECERFAQTILYLTELYKYGRGSTDEEKLKNAGYIDENYIQNKISQKGIPFSLTPSKNRCGIYEACPEVTLFCNNELFGFIPEKAIISGSWDNEWRNNEFDEDGKFNIHEVRHYSECAEFAHFIFEKQPNKRKKAIIPPSNYVYIMHNKQNDYYKIGRSTNPRYRETTLQAQEPDIELVEAWEAPKKIETELHRKFKSKKIRGEWFRLDLNDLNSIYSFMEERGY
jgi:hypothetical protein